MNAIPFDTLKFARKLREAGFPAEQAEKTSEALGEAMDGSEIATKSDIMSIRNEIFLLRNDVKSDIRELKSEIRELRSESKADILLLKWMFGTLVAGVAALVAKTFLVDR